MKLIFSITGKSTFMLSLTQLGLRFENAQPCQFALKSYSSQYSVYGAKSTIDKKSSNVLVNQSKLTFLANKWEFDCRQIQI